MSRTKAFLMYVQDNINKTDDQNLEQIISEFTLAYPNIKFDHVSDKKYMAMEYHLTNKNSLKDPFGFAKAINIKALNNLSEKQLKELLNEV